MNLSNFSERLSELMFEAGENGRTLPGKIGCGENTVYRYLQGSHIPTVEMVIALADFFNCSADFLLGLEDESFSHSFEKAPPFKERFAELLKQCDITQYRLEKLTGISHSAMVYWKNGTKQPTIDSIIRIAKTLDKSVDFVLGRAKF